MKKFYIVTDGIDRKIFSSLTGNSSQGIIMDGDKIYYYKSDYIENSQLIDQVSIFGTDEFNQLESAITCQTGIISSLPISPVDGGWYLIAQDADYNNIVTITLDGPISGVIVGDSVVAENGAVGIVTVIATNDLTIKYNGTAFSQAAGSSEIHEGTVFVSGTVTIQDIIDENKVGPFTSNIVSNPNSLVYYDSTANALWKILKPFEGINIIYDGNTYIWNTSGGIDNRWKLISSVLAVGNSNLVEISTDLSAPGSTTTVNSSIYSGGAIQYTVANIDTDVTMRAEGSNDETNWFNLDASDLDTTYIANGTYAMVYTKKYKYTRLTMVSENGGTAVTIEDISFFLTN